MIQSTDHDPQHRSEGRATESGRRRASSEVGMSRGEPRVQGREREGGDGVGGSNREKEKEEKEKERERW
eukprot:1639673-Rhodomonas_salina.3